MNHRSNMQISVVMTTYNGEKYIKDQLDSILINLDENDQLLIGDDGSTDQTLKILDSYANSDARIQIVKSNHLGTTKNIENLLRRTTGEIVFIADQDDVWEPNKVSSICAFFDGNYDIDLVFHNSKVSKTDINDIMHPSLFEFLKPSDRFFGNLVHFYFWGCMFAFRSRTLRYILPFRFGFDSWIMFCTTFLKKCHIDERILMTYRRHGENLSSFKRHNLLHVIASRVYRIIIFVWFLPLTYKGYKKSRK